MARYYDIANKQEWLGEEPLPAGVVVLPDENVFWDPLPPGFELTFDGGGLPDGTQAVVFSADMLIINDLQAAGISHRTIALAMYADGRGDSSLLTAVDSAIDTVVTDHSTTIAGVMNVL